jgi:thiamine transporter
MSKINDSMPKNGHSTTKQLVFCAISIALAFVTSYIKFAKLPFGGSITLFSMFFICFTGYLYGPRAGIFTGLAYGILQFLQEPYFYSVGQFLLDYPLAFACLGMSGFLRAQKLGLQKGILLGIFGRYLCHVLSGYIFFGMYAPEGMNPLVYTLGYNLTYILPELVTTLLVVSIPSVKSALNQVQRMA